MIGNSIAIFQIKWISASLLLCAISAFEVLTLRDGHVWDDDAAMYILHARNIAEGRAYGDTGYIYNPDYPLLGPANYPPALPLMLSPIYHASGLNLRVMKMTEVFTLVAALAVMLAYFYRAKYLGWPATLALVAMYGFSPCLCDYKDFIGTDLPFLFFTYLFLFAAETWEGRPKSAYAVILGLLAFVAYSTRSLGITLTGAFLLYYVLRRRRLTWFAIVLAATAGALSLAQSLLLHTGPADQAGLFSLRPGAILHNAIIYIKSLREPWMAGQFAALSWITFLAVTGLAAIGFADRLRSRAPIRLLEIFTLLYLAVLLAYTFQTLRFLFPVLPVYLMFALRGAELLAPRPVIAATGLLLIAATYALEFRTPQFGPIREGFLESDFLNVVAFIRQNTKPSDIFIFRRPRLLVLLAGRRAVAYALRPDLGAFVHTLHSPYVVLARSPSAEFAADAQFFWPYVNAHPEAVEWLYSNPGWAVGHLR